MTQQRNLLFKRFLASKDGTFAVMASVGMFVIVLVVAVAIDSTRLMQASSKLRSINDMAAIAATEGQNRSLSERKAIYEKVMQNGIDISDEITGYTYDLTFSDDGLNTILSATSRSEAELFFPVTRGTEGKFVTAHSEVTVGREYIEISLALDISTSMQGQRIIELQKAATDFVEIILDNEENAGRVSVAIIPFGGTVLLPDNLETMLTPPPTTEHWVDEEWNGCLAMSPIDYASGITPQHKLTYLPHFYAFTKNNPWCPKAGNKMVGLSTDKTMLIDKISSLTLSDGTGTDIGVAWALATLDPRWRNQIDGVNQSSPRDFNARTRKIMVVMADGGITGQRTPSDSELNGNLPFKVKNQTNTTAEAQNGYQDICNLTKSRGVEVYTVGFQITQQHKLNQLQICGTSQAHNYEVNLGELSSAFENIAASISGLRLSE